MPRPRRAREVLAAALYAIDGGKWDEITPNYQDQYRGDADTLFAALRKAGLEVVERDANGRRPYGSSVGPDDRKENP